MKKINKTWVLIIILIILTVILLIVSVATKKSEPEAKIPPVNSEISQKEVALTTLTIADEPRVSTVSGRYEVDVIINTDENEVTLAQLELIFDPNLLRIYGIKPGSFITNPEILQENIDSENGRISYWIGIDNNQRWIQGEGAIATISFTKIGSGSAQIDFSPKSSVSANSIDNSVLIDTFPGFINELPTKTPTPTFTPPITITPGA